MIEAVQMIMVLLASIWATLADTNPTKSPDIQALHFVASQTPATGSVAEQEERFRALAQSMLEKNSAGEAVDDELAALAILANDGHAPSAYMLYHHYHSQEGAPEGASKAAEFLRLAAKNGHPAAQYELAEQIGAEEKQLELSEQRLGLYTASATKGYVAAQLKLGDHFSTQTGRSESLRLAHKWYSAAAEQNSSQAIYNLGILFATGLGEPQDELKALELWKRAADMSFGPAQYQLGHVYIEGRLVRRDLIEAYKWMSFSILFSSEMGQDMFDDAVRIVDRMKEVLPEAQLADAGERMNAWWNRPKSSD